MRGSDLYMYTAGEPLEMTTPKRSIQNGQIIGWERQCKSGPVRREDTKSHTHSVHGRVSPACSIAGFFQTEGMSEEMRFKLKMRRMELEAERERELRRLQLEAEAEERRLKTEEAREVRRLEAEEKEKARMYKKEMKFLENEREKEEVEKKRMFELEKTRTEVISPHAQGEEELK
ncbi:MAP7 domain-containing protein 1-like [Scylla paramamosain]|uniref:MAP7 domain-containing protein 1-like n=1 Tax=Scylla paramamosain TaxID=85552 RepID=UPI003083AC15